jgi:ribosome modulation factor
MSTIFQRGYRAGNTGRLKADCPHVGQTEDERARRKVWMEGFDHGANCAAAAAAEAERTRRKTKARGAYARERLAQIAEQ